ncbi:hypothetical protein RJT34_31972 [Clitoria ternatea]|uniref:Uncharacterized protein n=1 Tax=Clitoria ternatea TaxID=43366 RepID=A0AAN9EXD4_CLITE
MATLVAPLHHHQATTTLLSSSNNFQLSFKLISMGSIKACTLWNLIAIVICMAILIGHNRVEGSRVLLDSDEGFAFATSNHLKTYTTTTYEQAKNTMAFWLQRLASGPSPKGQGH